MIPEGFGFPHSVSLPEDERTACSSSGSQTTTGRTALRDADKSPRVDILLPGGDGLLLSSPLLCRASKRHDVNN